MKPIRIAIVGLGKVAHDQHVPAILANPDLEIAATASADGASIDGIPSYASLDALLAATLDVDAVALCTPPQVRYALATTAITRGLHVFLEKPPVATIGEAGALAEQAGAAGVTLFAAWHSRFASGVEPAKAWLADRKIRRTTVTWREDVRTWHPGQAWIWRTGGFGVFDPGINALSILTHILPGPIAFAAAELEIPANREAPIAARLALHDAAGAAIAVDFDWRQIGSETWDIAVETDAGTLLLSRGGSVLAWPDGMVEAADREYPAMYAHFAALVRGKNSNFDVEPLRLVVEALQDGTVIATDRFDD
ncbi:MAG: Gfo/Idh/MocA family oxidoreductase [Sphingomonadales bacterium]|nr:MAG: Gfo/Idh/MocA family oxidoreductase [Sphingomonadales bacterium]